MSMVALLFCRPPLELELASRIWITSLQENSPSRKNFMALLAVSGMASLFERGIGTIEVVMLSILLRFSRIGGSLSTLPQPILSEHVAYRTVKQRNNLSYFENGKDVLRIKFRSCTVTCILWPPLLDKENRIEPALHD